MTVSNLVNRKFSRLKVLKFSHVKNSQRYWECKCDCGKIAYVPTHSLNSGNTKSCGCLQKESAAIAGANSSTTHGLSKKNKKPTRIFRIWMGMKARCLNKNVVEYSRYGGRGISLCSEWMSFEVFHTWAFKNNYNDLLSIERIDVNGNYCPENCTWIPKAVQAKNRRSSRFLTVNGERKIMSDLANQYGISSAAILSRLKRGWNEEAAVLTPVNVKHHKKQK